MNSLGHFMTFARKMALKGLQRSLNLRNKPAGNNVLPKAERTKSYSADEKLVNFISLINFGNAKPRLRQYPNVSGNSMKQYLLVCTILVLLTLCNSKKNKSECTNHAESILIETQSKLKNDLLSNSKLNPIVKYYILDTTAIVLLDQITDSIQYKSLGDINGDGRQDSIFLMPEFLYNDSTKSLGSITHSFTFTDKSLSRIQKDKGCNQLDDLFVTNDIDEDGIKELGLYTSSCASHYKALRVFSYKNGSWKEEGVVTFDLFHDNPPKEERIKKTSKGKFALREISDLGIENKFHDAWIDFEIK